MSEDDAQAKGAQPQGGVFGNLPESRPGTRSPRRDRGKRGPAKPSAAKAKAAKPKATRPKPEPRAAPKSPPEPAEAEPRRRPQPVAEERGGLEEIAWAGVAAAAEAATLGVKLANRALEALRGNSERS